MKNAMLTLILLTILSLALVLAFETGKAQLPNGGNIIRIRSDGTVEGTDKIQRSGNVYTLNGDIYGYAGSEEAFIFVERDNIVIDGAGYTLQGNGGGTGILMLRRQGVTIKNINIKGFGIGINFWAVLNFPSDSKYWGLPPASGNSILNSTIETPAVSQFAVEAPGWGIYLQEASGTLISGNTITTHDPNGGIYFGFRCDKTTLLNNKFVGGSLFLTDANQNTIINNTVDNKPLIHLDGASNQVVDGAGQVFLFNSNNITVRNIYPLADYRTTVQLKGTKNSEVTESEGNIVLIDSTENVIHGNSASMIGLFDGSDHNKVFGNRIESGDVIYPRAMSDYEYGLMCIQLDGSSYNDVYENTLLNSNRGVQLGGIVFGGSYYNNIYRNTILNHDVGAEIQQSSNNAVYANNITNCGSSINLISSSQNKFSENNVAEGNTGVRIWESNDNLFYHNNFINNTHNVLEEHESYFPPFYRYSVNNTWDDGKEGNYWSDYNGSDGNGDGIGDTPYSVFENMTDYYPLMKPIAFDITPPAVSIISPENKTYATNNIPLTVFLNEPASSIAYSLDGQENVMITGNATLTGLPNGDHNVTVYATDEAGNTGASETMYFSVDAPEPFPTALVATASGTALAVVGVGLLVYFKKRRN